MWHFYMKTKIYIINFIYPHQFISKKKNQQKMLMHKIKIELGYQQINKKNTSPMIIKYHSYNVNNLFVLSNSG